jgi:ubiquitin C-terminal hydrolase
MDTYQKEFVPPTFGLNNSGVVCHFNSLLQSLAGCPGLVKAVLSNPSYMEKTKTGKEFYAFINAFATLDGAKKTPDAGIELHSSNVLNALVADLRVRRPSVTFGASQESASEGLVLLLDMMEPPPAEKKESSEGKEKGKENGKEPKAEDKSKTEESPVTRLFLHRYRCELHCSGCKNVVASNTDLAVKFFPTHIDQMSTAPSTPSTFSDAVRRHVEPNEDYFCKECKKKQPGYRLYRLSMIPEIAVILFKVYHHPRPKRFIPDKLEFPGMAGETMNYRQVAQIEHYGVLSGGHYLAKVLRNDGKVYVANDNAPAQPSMFMPHSGNPNTYIAFFHYNGNTSKEASLAAQMSALSLENSAAKAVENSAKSAESTTKATKSPPSVVESPKETAEGS